MLPLLIFSCESESNSTNENTSDEKKLTRIEYIISGEPDRVLNYYLDYNTFGNITKISNEIETQYTYNYNTNNDIVKIEGYDLVNLETKINIEIAYVYDDQNQLIERHFRNDETIEQWENPQSKYYEYDGNDVLITSQKNSSNFSIFSYSDNNILLFSVQNSYQYDDLGNIIYFSNTDETVTVSAEYTPYLKYDIQSQTYPLSSEKNNPNLNTISIAQLYSNYFLSEITYTQIAGTETLTTNIVYDYEFDSMGRLTKKTENTEGSIQGKKVLIVNYYWE